MIQKTWQELQRNPVRLSYLYLHFSVLLWGFTAVLGDIINTPAILLVWWRMLLTVLSLAALVYFFRIPMRMQRQNLLQYLGIGVLIGLHWVCFYQSIQWTSPSITLVCLSTTSFLTTLIEPFFLGSKFNYRNALIGLLIIPGMALVVNSIDSSWYGGIYMGLLAALFAALFSTWNKMMISRADPIMISFIELGGGWLFLTLLIGLLSLGSYVGMEQDLLPHAQLSSFTTIPDDISWILLLALGCTTLPFILSLKALAHIPVFNSNLIINLEPVYGTLLSALILQEHHSLAGNVYLGMFIVLMTVLLYPILQRRELSENN